MKSLYANLIVLFILKNYIFLLLHEKNTNIFIVNTTYNFIFTAIHRIEWELWIFISTL
ncbi:MAG: hypothetical protein BWX61_01099 [Bacteroidetes bacterium ADurb.Bin035]|nr:MAG: hypothetical protein BWX61_01099 [Bacteroidetes bacterium ADurb.Bin035]